MNRKNPLIQQDNAFENDASTAPKATSSRIRSAIAKGSIVSFSFAQPPLAQPKATADGIKINISYPKKEAIEEKKIEVQVANNNKTTSKRKTLDDDFEHIEYGTSSNKRFKSDANKESSVAFTTLVPAKPFAPPQGTKRLMLNNNQDAPPNAIIWHLNDKHYCQMENGQNVALSLKDPSFKYEFEFRNGTTVPADVIVREYYKEYFLQLSDGTETQIFEKGTFENNFQYASHKTDEEDKKFWNIYGDAVENREIVEVIPEGVVPVVLDPTIAKLINHYPTSAQFSSFFSGKKIVIPDVNLDIDIDIDMDFDLDFNFNSNLEF